MRDRHHVVVIGGGFGGLAVARGLKGQPVDVTLIDANNFTSFSPLLYQVATAGLAADDIAYAIRGLFRRQGNVGVRMAVVDAIDLDERIVHTNVGRPVGFDTLVVAAGAVSHGFGVPGVDEFALPLKSLEDALAIRNHIIARFEAAATDPKRVESGDLDVVVCGGGPTGVELAGATIELFHRVLAKDFPELDSRRWRVVVVEAADRLLGTFTELSSRRAERTLTRLGVEVRTGVGVAKVDGREVWLSDGSCIRAGTVLWTAGVRAHPIAEMLAVPLTRGGRIIVGDDLSVPGHPELFAVGDIAANPAAPLPQVALPAIQGGKHVARQIVRRLSGMATEPFIYRDLGTMATIGRHDAIAEFPRGLRLAGPLGWFSWLGLHVVRLMGGRNRLTVIVNWAWNYITYDRASRSLVGLKPDDELSVE